MATAIYGFSTLVGFVDDPFFSLGNEKPIRIATTAAILGIFLALRSMQVAKRKQRLAVLGLALNFCAIVVVSILLPCL